MRRFQRSGVFGLCPARFFIVGTRGNIPEIGSLSAFESRRRRRIRLSSENARDDRQISSVPRVPAVDEDEAKSVCFENYGFLQKPLKFAHWSAFLQELRRIEFRWTLAPSVGGVIVFTALEHGGEGEKVLCKIKGSTGSAPIAEFFECCGTLTQGSCDKRSVRFLDIDGGGHVLSVVSKRKIDSNNAAPPVFDEPILPVLAQYNCRGTSVDVSVIDTRTDVVTPVFHELSLQAFNYAFLTSIPVFLKRADVGIRNADFVSKEQMRHFRFAWCFLRRESMMTAVEMNELDFLLPP
ncbi:hypothetical protein TRSC58_01623 [Trypanosoma rangeli SC58]|uniref:Uncharacterized protein n=1 Tax=Trypanosoma rangeli SC58 TaxID=429131 RepID=A0A061J8J4_TRYRA|nr:hypothetical protein TRSC58_01623 [Trypanosoma rangeli SC58]